MLGVQSVATIFAISKRAYSQVYSFTYMNIHPLSYAIPDEYIVADVPEKTHLLSDVVPGNRYTYAYRVGEEEAYLNQYRVSRFAETSKKGGWDCLRHYEIIASGCIPVFKDLDTCPQNTMTTFPKALVVEACAALLPWNPGKEALYDLYVRKLLDHCRRECSVSALAQRFLAPFPGAKRVLMIQCQPGENYSREFLSIGLRRSLGNSFIDYPKIDVLYKGCDMSRKHGNGFIYGGKLDDIEIDRGRIEERIAAKEFDLVVYGKVGRDELHEGSIPRLPLWSLVQASYPRNQIAFLYGGDGCQNLRDLGNPYTRHLLEHATNAVCFVRELL